MFQVAIGLTSKRHKYRQASFAGEKIGEKFFRIFGPCSQAYEQRIGYGTGRSILAHGFNHMQETFSHIKDQTDKEFDDDRVFAPLWNQQDVRGIILPEPIYDTGSPQNWFFAISRGCD